MADTLSFLCTVWFAVVIAAISPGPNMVAVVSYALGSGRKSGILVSFGIAIGGFFWALSTTLGLSILFEKFPILLKVLSVLGGGYLSWLGYKSWRAALKNTQGEIGAQTSKGPLQDIRYGLLITATNPKAALFWISLSIFITEKTHIVPLLLLYAFGASIALFVTYSSYAMLFSIETIRKIYSRFEAISNAIFGSVFTLIGMSMIWRIF